MKIEFNPGGHQYKIDGKSTPSVSQIIGADYSHISDDILNHARAIGNAVHKACELWDNQTINPDTISPIIAPYLSAWKQFKEQTGLQILESETPIASKKWGFAGTPDRIGKIKDMIVVVDIKSGILTPYAGLQTAGYKIAWEEINGKKIKKRLIVQLTAEGKYKMTPFEDKMDEGVFISFVQVYQWKQRNKIL